MAKKPDDIMVALQAQHRARIEGRAMKLATPKVLRKVVEASEKIYLLYLTLFQTPSQARNSGGIHIPARHQYLKSQP